MHIVLGATGHVGSALARALLDRGEPVRIVSRDARKAQMWQRRGAQTAVVDVHDGPALARVFKEGKRLFLLNPPAPPSLDTAAEERKSLKGILAALEGSGLEKIVAESTYGAQPGHRVGDLGVLYEMEQALAAQPIPTTVIRASYYMSNWEASLPLVVREHVLTSFFPAAFALPMVAPQDIGRVAAQLMMAPVEKTGMVYVEGPERYSPADVAAAFGASLKAPVRAVQIPDDQWIDSMKAMGFSQPAAESFAAMTAATLRADFPPRDATTRGATSLQRYIEELVRSERPELPFAQVGSE